ncbi:hypothetical protein BD410DRAFT_788533 [Rickenella mellea]|uniref:Vps72/YL1 C-terminal domain-containing protein n=1 Tax=Rickenella mellea TaxID=50990 RepID=A0A4Y7Q505_9AGAM|nr:hypothetical protein BD410DRAFT_788533 [Rickenella mellea]
MEDNSLVARRSKRSTAGNRMEAALAEIAAEEVSMEGDDDIDFIDPEDEEEIFDSDFESTDEEAAPEEGGAAEEKVIQAEEKRERRSARQRVVKATDVANERHKATFNPQAASEPRPKKPRKRVSLRFSGDGEIGERGPSSYSKRKSRRESTMLSSQILNSRLKLAEERKATNPKRIKEVFRRPTQAELIQRALDTEEGNIVEHRDYLSQEEEKRRRAKVVRKTISGPVVRWISKGEQVKVKVTPTFLPSYSTYGSSMPPYSYQPGSSQLPPYSNFPGFTSTRPFHPSSSEYPSNFQPSQQASVTSTITPSSFTHSSVSFIPSPIPVTTATRLEKATKNYLVHELDQVEGTAKPKWDDSMTAFFGDHVKWNEVKVFAGKSRPYGRPVTYCPITGRPAPYRDPRTGVPYANANAYRVLTRVLSHEYVWNVSNGCYTGAEHFLDPNSNPATN